MSLEQSIQNLADAIKYHADAVKLAKTSDAPTSVSVDIIPADVAAEVEAVKAEAKPAKAKKAATKKAAKPDTVTEEEAEVEVKEATEATANDVRTAAMAVRDEVGRDELSGALKKFKAKKISDLDESKYNEFVAYCEELVEAGAND